MGIVNNDDEKQIRSFIDSMLKRGFLISENPNISLVSNNKRTFRDYEILDYLKESDYETVCLAKPEKSESKVILKFLSFELTTAEDVKRKRRDYFEHEFSIMNKISNNSSICNLISFDKKRDLAILEYIEGKTLKELIKNKELLVNQKVQLTEQIVRVIAFLHNNDIIHGDIHANQFIVNNSGILKLIDFGLSFDKNIGLNNQVIRRGGIHNYLEPENITPNAFANMCMYTPDYHSEVYRIGVLLYFLFYEKYPFDSFSWLNLYEQIKTKPFELETLTPQKERIPEPIINVIEKALSKKPESRFSSAIAMEKHLNQMQL
jgi:serine/threonine-protein kinase